MRKLLRSLAAPALALLGMVTLTGTLAAQITVSSLPNQTFTSLNLAVMAAQSADTITVSGGPFFGGATVTGKRVTIVGINNAVLDNTAQSGNGVVYNYPIVSFVGSSASGSSISGITLQNSGHQVTTGGPLGAVYINDADVTVSYNVFQSNYCAAIYSTGSNPLITGNTITSTSSASCTTFEGDGSAIVLTGNNANAAATTHPQITGNTIYGNTTSLAYTSDKGGGGAINITAVTTPVYITENILRNNTSAGYGGAAYIATTPSIYFLNNLVYGNKGISGGLDIVVPGSSVGPVAGLLANNTIGYNTGTTASAGSDIYIGGNLAQYQMANNIVIGATNGQTALDCGVTYAGQTITPLVLDHNDFTTVAGTTAVAVGGACSNPAGLNGNLASAPGFKNVTSANVASGTADFSLSTSSPLIDQGNNSAIEATEDIVGQNRFVDYTTVGYPITDIGAYELQSSTSCGKCTPVAEPVVNVLQVVPSTYTPVTGKTITLTASFYGAGSGGAAPAAGTVITFYEDGAVIGTSPTGSTAGSATFTTAALTAGLHTFKASSPGDANNAPATSVFFYLLVQAPTVVNPTTTLVASPNPGGVGQTITLTATVTAPNGTFPAGTVYFIDGAVTLGSTTTSTSTGAYTYSSTFTAGTHSLTAAFVPSDTSSYNGSTGSTTLTIIGATDTVALTSTPSGTAVYGQPLTLYATVTPSGTNTKTPSGSMTFYVDGSTAANAIGVVNGVATFQASGYAAGTHTFGCDYSGDGTFAPATCANITIIIVNGIPTTSTLAVTPTTGLTTGDPVQMTATVGPTQPQSGYPEPTGNVSFLDNGTVVGTAAVVPTGASGYTAVGNFTYTTTGGAHTYSCTYAGDKVYAPSTCGNTVPVTVAALGTSMTLTPAANPEFAVAPFTLTATLTDARGKPAPNSTITLTQSGVTGSVTATTNASGVATFNVSAGVSSASFQASFAASSSYGASNASTTVAITPNNTTGTLIAQPTTAYEGQTITVVVSILNTSSNVSAAGAVSLYDGTTLLSTQPLPASVAGQTLTSVTFPVSTLVAATHTLSAVYMPTPNFLASTIAPVTVTISPSSFTISQVPSVTIETQHHGSTTVTLNSIGNFSGGVTLSFIGALPPVLSTSFSQNPVQLSAGGSSKTTLYLETDAIANFAFLPFALPFALLPLALHKRSRKLVLCAVFTLAALIPLSGCSGHYPDHTPPGTYNLTLQAVGTSPTGNHVTQTTQIQLVVTP